MLVDGGADVNYSIFYDNKYEVYAEIFNNKNQKYIEFLI